MKSNIVVRTMPDDLIELNSKEARDYFNSPWYFELMAAKRQKLIDEGFIVFPEHSLSDAARRVSRSKIVIKKPIAVGFIDPEKQYD